MPKKSVASKKRPRDSLPGDRFRSPTAAKLFDDHFSQRSLFLERNVLIDELHDSGIVPLLVNRGWGPLLSGCTGPSPQLVQEFYSNMEVVTPTSFSVYIRGSYLDIDPSVLSRVLAIPEVPFPEYPWPPTEGPSDQLILDVASGQHRPFVGGTIVVATLLPSYRLLNRIVCHNLWPKSHVNTQPIVRIAFLYAIEQGLSIDILSVILREMTRIRTSSYAAHTLPYGCLIRRIISALIPGFVHDPPLPLLKPIGRQTVSSGAAHLPAHARAPAPDPAPAPAPAPPPSAAASSSSAGPPPDFYQRILDSQASILAELRLLSGGQSEIRSTVRSLQAQFARHIADCPAASDNESSSASSESD